MSGPEHYREAERIEAAAKSKDRAGLEGFTGWSRTDLAALAQVHATLALVAATLECATDLTPPQEFPGNGNHLTQGANDAAWQEALS